MDANEFPTKGNLILARNTLKLSQQGYDLMDKKRNVLIKEIMDLNEEAIEIQSNIETTFAAAYKALQEASINMGISKVEAISYGVPIEENINIRTRSVMGVEIPIITYKNSTKGEAFFGFGNSSKSFDDAFEKFNMVKDLIVELATVENSVYRLAINISKTQKRANALKNVTIPKYKALEKRIQNTLEEQERDEFTRLKVIKQKQ